MNKIYDLIFEELAAKIIDETYKSVNEIKQLANDVIKSIASNNIKQIKQNGEIRYIAGTYLNNIDTSKFDEIKNFINDTNIAIMIDEKTSSTRGSYITPTFRSPYKANIPREIEINVDDLDGLLERIDKKVKETGVDKYDEHDLYFDLFYELYGPLIHELQHAYDDYRSGSKMYQTKEFEEYQKKFIENQINSDIEQAKKYVNLPHEIWARFSQAMHKVHFTDMDIKDGKIVFEMKPIKKVVKDFVRHFDHYSELSDQMKKKLTKKVVQFWHYEQDNLDEKTKKANRRTK